MRVRLSQPDTFSPARQSTRIASKRFRAVLFDHDGTLIDSLPVVVAASNAVLVAHGHAPCRPEDIIAGMILPTAPRMAHHAGSTDSAHARALAQSYYTAALELVHLARPYAGIAALLDHVHDAAIALAVVSNNDSRFVRQAMTAAGFTARIPALFGEDDIPAPKPHPGGLLVAARHLNCAPSTCMYVGDSPVDAQAALAAGMTAIGVGWGTHRRAELAHCGFATIIDHPAELLALLAAP